MVYHKKQDTGGDMMVISRQSLVMIQLAIFCLQMFFIDVPKIQYFMFGCIFTLTCFIVLIKEVR